MSKLIVVRFGTSAQPNWLLIMIAILLVVFGHGVYDASEGPRLRHEQFTACESVLAYYSVPVL